MEINDIKVKQGQLDLLIAILLRFMLEEPRLLPLVNVDSNGIPTDRSHPSQKREAFSKGCSINDDATTRCAFRMVIE